jgi:MFS family permease
MVLRFELTCLLRYFIRQYTGLPYPDPNDAVAVKAFVIPASKQSLVTSILSAGTFFGAIIAGDVADFLGRRLTIILGCVIFTIGCILEVASTGIGLMVPGRLICGAGVGFISAIVILYMSASLCLSTALDNVFSNHSTQ